MNPAITSMLEKYNCQTRQDYENALKEIIQQIALLGLWRAKFFQHAAFYGGTALRILYGLDRFSEDIDFSLLAPKTNFQLAPYLEAIKAELNGMDLNVEIVEISKNIETPIESAFLKASTKEHLLKIEVPEQIASRIARENQLKIKLKIKLEIDTQPPGGFETEAKILLAPIPFSVTTYKLPDLFAGKIHAVLQRSWQSDRVKGRDFYDFVWYISRDTPVRLKHLEARLRQSGAWTSSQEMTQKDLLEFLEEKFRKLDVEQARKDVLPFLKDQAAVEIWSSEFFLSLLPKIRVSA
jgi:predicted nucleotidyltransferase component of viral defense system